MLCGAYLCHVVRNHAVYVCVCVICDGDRVLCVVFMVFADDVGGILLAAVLFFLVLQVQNS